MVPGVDVQRRAGYVAGILREEVGGRGAAVLGVHMAVQRGALLEHLLHRREARDRPGRERSHRAGRDGVDADVRLAQIPGEVANGGVERRLGDAHHVVVGHGALAAEVRHGQDRAAAAALHQRFRTLRRRHERVGADVHRHPEPVTRRVGEAALEVLCRRERDRVDEAVEASAEHVCGRCEDAVEVGVGADVALADDVAADRLGQLAHALLDPLALVGERELGALRVEALRDRPRDRALVGDAQHEHLLALEPACHPAILVQAACAPCTNVAAR